MSEGFDPYYSWLGIPPAEQPADYYRLLGLSRFESNAEAISNAAERQIRHLRSFAIGPHSEFSQQLLNEVISARICLLNSDKKAAYDQSLGGSSTVTQESLAPVAAPFAPHAPPTTFESLAPSAALVPQEVLPPMALPLAANSLHPAPTTTPSSPIVLQQRRSHGRASAQNRSVRRVISIVIGGVMGCVIGWFIIFVYLPKLEMRNTRAQRSETANNSAPAAQASRAVPPPNRALLRVPPVTPMTPPTGSSVAEPSPTQLTESEESISPVPMQEESTKSDESATASLTELPRPERVVEKGPATPTGPSESILAQSAREWIEQIGIKVLELREVGDELHILIEAGDVRSGLQGLQLAQILRRIPTKKAVVTTNAGTYTLDSRGKIHLMQERD